MSVSKLSSVLVVMDRGLDQEDLCVCVSHFK